MQPRSVGLMGYFLENDEEGTMVSGSGFTQTHNI